MTILHTTTKSSATYITLSDGTDYRKISQIMSDAGYKMNHATARNVLMSGLVKLVKHMSESLEMNITEEGLINLLKNSDFHEGLSDILFEAVGQDNEKEGEKISCQDQNH